jgi:PAS domain S-box-containing protein
MIGGQFVIQRSLFRVSGDAGVVNIAGRQRMFSQRIAKDVLQIDAATSSDKAKFYVQDLEKSLRQFVAEHEELRSGDPGLLRGDKGSVEIPSIFNRIEPYFQKIVHAVEAVIASQRMRSAGDHPKANTKRNIGQNAVNASISLASQEVLQNEGPFVEGMDDIVNRFVAESSARSNDLVNTELSLLLTTLLGLVALAVFVFRPAISQIRTAIAALELAENRLDGIVASMGEGLFQLNGEGAVIFANKSFERILGYGAQEVIGKPVHDLLHPVSVDHDPNCALQKALMVQKEIEVTDDKFCRKDGKSIPVEIVCAPIFRAGERAGTIVTFRDASEQSLTHRRLGAQSTVTRILRDSISIEDALPKILEALCRTLDLQLGIMWMVDSEHSLLRCSDVWYIPGEPFQEYESTCRQKVYRQGEGVPGKSWETKEPLYFSNLSDVLMQSYSAVKADLVASFSFPVMFSQKVLGVIQLYGTSVAEPDQELLTIVASLGTQIGEFIQRRRTEYSLDSSESRLNAIINSMAEGVIVADKGGRFLLINQAAKDMHHTSHIETSVTNWTRLFGYYTADRKTPVAQEDLPLLKAVRGESVDNVEMFLPLGENKDEGLWISCTARPLRNERGDLIGGVVVMNDMTRRKVIEKRLSDFYSTVSHELRTPLTSIKAALGLLEGGVAGDLSKKAMQLVTVGRSESDRMVRLINDILDIKKMEDDKFELNLQSISLKELVDQTVSGLEGLIVESQVKVETKLDCAGTVKGDKDRLVQVLNNLLSNAIKFSSPGGKVVVSVESQGESVRIGVTDQGCGIPQDQVHKLFGMFQQLNLGDGRNKSGSGLGLAICKRIVELHGGKIGFETEVEKGSTFWFELPLLELAVVRS